MLRSACLVALIAFAALASPLTASAAMTHNNLNAVHHPHTLATTNAKTPPAPTPAVSSTGAAAPSTPPRSSTAAAATAAPASAASSTGAAVATTGAAGGATGAAGGNTSGSAGGSAGSSGAANPLPSVPAPTQFASSPFLSDTPDVYLIVPDLSVKLVSLEVDTLAAHLALNADVAKSFVSISAGVDVSIDRVKLEIDDVEAQLELQVRLGNVVGIASRALDTLDRNPDLLANIVNAATNSLLNGSGQTVGGTGTSGSAATGSAPAPAAGATGAAAATGGAAPTSASGTTGAQ